MASSIIEAYQRVPATSGTGYALANNAEVGDVLVVFSTNYCATTVGATTATVSGALASGGFVQQAYDYIGTNNTIVTCLTAVVTTAGTPTISVTYGGVGGNSLAWNAFIVRGLSSGTANVAGTNKGTGTTLTVSLSPTVQCALLIGWGNLATDAFTSFNGSITQSFHSTAQSSAVGYELAVASGAKTPGINCTSNASNVIAAIYLPETGGGGGATGPLIGATHLTNGGILIKGRLI